MNDDCVFCKIIDGKLPARFVRRDGDVIAFEDLNPQAPTHVLIIPRKHIPTLLDVDDGDAPLIALVHRVASEIARERGLEDGFRVVVNNGAGAGQTVYHLHFHLLGGRPMRWPPG